LTFPIIIFTGF